MAQQERGITRRERGIMGSGEPKRNNKNSDTHSYNRPQSDPPGELHKAVINSISGQNKKRKDIILAVKNLIKDLTVFIVQ